MPDSEMVNAFASHWWLLLLRGLFAVLFGLMALFLPGLTLVTLLLLCGFYFIMDGVTALLIGVRAHTWSLLLSGVLGIIAGILTFVYPGTDRLLATYSDCGVGDRNGHLSNHRSYSIAQGTKQRMAADHRRRCLGSVRISPCDESGSRGTGNGIGDWRIRPGIWHHLVRTRLSTPSEAA